MKTSLRQLALAPAVVAVTASFSLPSFAQDVRREDSVTYYLQMDKIDANKDGMVSKKEFMDAMSRGWDMHMAGAGKSDSMMAGSRMADTKMADTKMHAAMPRDKMTLQQYLEFSKMFGLNVGG